MTPGEIAIAMATLPEANRMPTADRGRCWHDCSGLVYWPRAPHGPCIVRCDSEFNPHVGVTSGST